MTSSSPVESYRAVLKRKGDASFGLVGAFKTVCSVDESYFNQTVRTQLDFRTKSLAETEAYPFLVGFPYPVQLLLVDEIRSFNRRIGRGS